MTDTINFLIRFAKVSRSFFLIVLTSNILWNCSSVKETSKSNDEFNKNNITLKKTAHYDKNTIELLKLADKSLKKNFKSVLEKEIIPPSGDMHDYLSRATYFWPNPNTEDGLPWISKDGNYNKKSFEQTNHKYYYETIEAVKDLSLAYSFTMNSKYAEKAAQLIRLWYIDSKTKMNPNMNFAQGVPGKYDGSPSGIIDSRGVLWIIQAIKLINPSGYFSEDDELSFKQWCNNFLAWLLTSDLGLRESKSKNNHGTYYDLQVASLSSFLQKDSIAVKTLEQVKAKRISIQIKPDGSQPLELERNSPHMYSIFNLSALVELAILGDKYNIDLWNYKNGECGSIKDAVDFLIENTTANSIMFKNKISENNLMRILPKLETRFPGEYEGLIQNIDNKNTSITLTDRFFVN